MFATQVQTPTLFSERTIDLLVGRFPPETTRRLRANLAAFRSWVAAPAYRAKSPKAAVAHVVAAVGPALQLKMELITALGEVPDGLRLFTSTVLEGPAELPMEPDSRLGLATEHLYASQRMWLRFMSFHPDLAAVQAKIGFEQIADAVSLGFHADNLLTVCVMGTDGTCGVVRPSFRQALEQAAVDYASRYHHAIKKLVKSAAPPFDKLQPFKQSTLADLLSLPPFDGPAVSVPELREAIGAGFSP